MTICILLPAYRRRKAKFATPCAMQGVCIQACGSSSPQIVLSFAPAKILSAGTSRCAALRGPLKQHHPMISCSRARFTLSDACLSDTYKKSSYISAAAVCNIPAPIRPSAVRNIIRKSLALGRALPITNGEVCCGRAGGEGVFCRKRCLYCQNRGISYRFGVECQYDDYLCACRHRVGQGGERERSFLRHGDGHSVCGHE